MHGSGAAHTIYGYHTRHIPCCGFQKQALRAQHFCALSHEGLNISLAILLRIFLFH
jgi:hypothetical protein